MSQQSFFYSLAYILGAPISTLVIGITLDQTYRSRTVPLNYRWGSNAVAVLSLAFTGLIIRENCTWIATESGRLVNSIRLPSTAQMLIPASIGCVEFVVQVYFIRRHLSSFGRSALVFVTALVCSFNLIAAWGCTISIFFKIDDLNQKKSDPFNSRMASFQIGSQALAIWLASSALAGLIIFGGQVWSSVRRSKQGIMVGFLKTDDLMTKIGVAILQTSALNTLLIFTIALIYIVDTTTENQPTPVTMGAFVFCNLIRIPINGLILVFSLVREHSLSIDTIQQLPSALKHHDKSDSLSLEEEPRNIFKNQVTVHTVRSQVFES